MIGRYTHTVRVLRQRRRTDGGTRRSVIRTAARRHFTESVGHRYGKRCWILTAITYKKVVQERAIHLFPFTPSPCGRPSLLRIWAFSKNETINRRFRQLPSDGYLRF